MPDGIGVVALRVNFDSVAGHKNRYVYDWYAPTG